MYIVPTIICGDTLVNKSVMSESFDSHYLRKLVDKHLTADFVRIPTPRELFAATVELVGIDNSIGRMTSVGFMSIDWHSKHTWVDPEHPQWTPQVYFHLPLEDALTGSSEAIRGLNEAGYLTAKIPGKPGLLLVNDAETELFCLVTSKGVEDLAQQLV